MRYRGSTRSTEEKLLRDSLDQDFQNTIPSTRNSGQTLNLPPGKLKKQLEKVLSLIRVTRSSLTKFETVEEAEEFERELEK